MIFTEWFRWLSEQLAAVEPYQRTLVLYVGAVAALAVFFLFMALRHFIGTYSQSADRLEEIIAIERAEEEERRAHRKRPGFLARLVSNLSIAPAIARDLDRANVALSVPEFVLIALCVAAAGFVLGLLRGSAILGILIGGTALMLVRLWLGRRARLRRLQFGKQLNDILSIVVGSLRAGYGIVQSLNIVVQEMPPPASQEMARITREVQLGLPVSVALDNSAERLENDDWTLVVTSIKIQAEVGGNLAEILDTVGETIRERIRILGEIRVLTTQQRLTGWALSILPVVLASVLFFINPEYMSGLFAPGLPLMLAMLGVAGIFVGAVVIRRIVAIDV